MWISIDLSFWEQDQLWKNQELLSSDENDDNDSEGIDSLEEEDSLKLCTRRRNLKRKDYRKFLVQQEEKQEACQSEEEMESCWDEEGEDDYEVPLKA